MRVIFIGILIFGFIFFQEPTDEEPGLFYPYDYDPSYIGEIKTGENKDQITVETQDGILHCIATLSYKTVFRINHGWRDTFACSSFARLNGVTPWNIKYIDCEMRRTRNEITILNDLITQSPSFVNDHEYDTSAHTVGDINSHFTDDDKKNLFRVHSSHLFYIPNVEGFEPTCIFLNLYKGTPDRIVGRRE